MMTFSEFVSLYEGKKQKEIDRLSGAFKLGRLEAGHHEPVSYHAGEPESPERKKAIAAMMSQSGGNAVISHQKEIDRRARKAAKEILKRNK